ncbi:MAG: ATP-binding protein [bacterium]
MRTRIQSGLSLLIGFFLLASLFAVTLFAITPATPATRGPILVAGLFAMLIGGLVCILFILRWLLRPYRQLVGEAERAPVESTIRRSVNEGEFVLETFQSVVAQLQAQREELEKLTAQAGERADSAVRFSERIVASVPSALIAFDGSGKTIVINGPGRALLEVDGKALGEPVHALLRNLPELSEMVNECLLTGRVYRREVVQTAAENGSVRRLGGTIAPIDLFPERDGRGALCLLTDITEVTHLREQVALKRNLESLGEMSAGLAHEFKNAIATLHGYVQLLQNLNLDDRGQAAASSLLNEVRNLSEMVTAFLNFARPQPLDLENVLLAKLLDDCAAELRPIFEEREVQLFMDTTDAGSADSAISATSAKRSLEIRADERMLRQAILNLLRNAAEAIPEGQQERMVWVRTDLEGDGAGKEWAVVEIEDSGQGIPAADVERIYIPFFTTKASGHGIGLALAHRVITQHGGTLEAGKARTGGAIFTVRLPE